VGFCSGDLGVVGYEGAEKGKGIGGCCRVVVGCEEKIGWFIICLKDIQLAVYEIFR
jgi:hypothetical protein